MISPIYYCICLEAIFWLKWHKIHWETGATDLINMQPSLLWSSFWLCYYVCHNKQKCFVKKNKKVFIWNSLVLSPAPTKLLSTVGIKESQKLLIMQMVAAVSWDSNCYFTVSESVFKKSLQLSILLYIMEDDLGNCFSFAPYWNLCVLFSFLPFPFIIFQIKLIYWRNDIKIVWTECNQYYLLLSVGSSLLRFCVTNYNFSKPGISDSTSNVLQLA